MRYEAITELRPERDVFRCLSESDDAKRAVIAHQGALGIGAYDGGLFVGSLWFYRIESRDTGCPLAPDHITYLRPEEFRRRSLEVGIPDQAFPLLQLDCFHVGRTKALEDRDEIDESYLRRGIGSGLLRAACAWAVERDFRSLVSTSGMDAFPEFNMWAGNLPLKVFLRNGFDILRSFEAQAFVPGHLRDLAEKIDPATLAIAEVINWVEN